MMLIGGSRSNLSHRLMNETSPSVARVALFSFSGRSEGDIEFPVSEFGGKPHGGSIGGDLSIRVCGQFVCCEIFLVPRSR